MTRFGVLVFIAIIFFSSYRLIMNSYSTKTVTFFIAGAPYSMDPLEYDWSMHHITQNSVFASLITKYKIGEYQSYLTESWKSSDDYTIWSFKIKPNLKYEDGSELNAETIRTSLLRLAYLLKKKHSHDGIFEHLQEYEKISSPNTTFSGIRVSGSTLEFHFVKPVKNFLDLISFGLYGIVNPKDFDLLTGEWQKPHIANSSGPYRIKEWTDHEFVLQLRSDHQKDYGHPKKFGEIVIKWEKEFYGKTDMLSGNSFSKDLSDYIFWGPVASSISYAQVLSWKSKSGLLSDLSTRKKIRAMFYHALQANGVKYTTSFIPLAICNPPQKNDEQQSNQKFEIKQTIKMAYPIQTSSFFPYYHDAIKVMAKDNSLAIETFERDFKKFAEDREPDSNHFHYDIAAASTSITLSDPIHDISFMFLSKSGIRLPDPTGKIKNMLNKSKIDVQEINQQIWDDALIWPLLHYSSGVWAKKHIDVSLLNLTMSQIDFSWVGEK